MYVPVRHNPALLWTTTHFASINSQKANLHIA